MMNNIPEITSLQNKEKANEKVRNYYRQESSKKKAK